jgi:hypothetical protein
MTRKVGQIVRRGDRIWLVCVYRFRDPESKKRKHLNKTVHGGLREAIADWHYWVAQGYCF